MKIRELMTHHPIQIRPDATMRRAAELLSVSEASDLMVTNEQRAFLGVLSEGDLLRAVLPSFDEVLDAGGTLQDAFSFFIRKGSSIAERPITALIIKDAIVVGPEHQAAQAAVIMIQRQIRRLPVVDNGLLVGTVSRSDVVRAVIYGW